MIIIYLTVKTFKTVVIFMQVVSEVKFSRLKNAQKAKSKRSVVTTAITCNDNIGERHVVCAVDYMIDGSWVQNVAQTSPKICIWIELTGNPADGTQRLLN